MQKHDDQYNRKPGALKQTLFQNKKTKFPLMFPVFNTTLFFTSTVLKLNNITQKLRGQGLVLTERICSPSRKFFPVRVAPN